jgi:2-amino-4-hydroxy-6-hydroxymethyldihydropteridine diphosphokinase
MTSVYLSLGSNIGNRRQHICDAIDELMSYPANSNLIQSTLIETSPMGVVEQQENYLNCVICLETILAVRDFFELTQDIEKRHGRLTKGDYLPRTLDIDILVFGTQVIQTSDLVIPHPRFHERNFVLEPLMEIAPNLIHPTLNVSVKDLYNNPHDYMDD